MIAKLKKTDDHAAELREHCTDSTQGHHFFSRLPQPLAAVVLTLCTLLLSSCRPPASYITAPNNRIQYFLANDFWRMKNQESYQSFIYKELGVNFTESDFATYMQENEAECSRDETNNILYCLYIDFKYMPYDLWNYYKSVHYYCFWALPPPNRPIVRFKQAGATSVQEFPANRNDLARINNLPGCRVLLLKMHRIEK